MTTENLYTPDCLRTYSGQYVNIKRPDPKTIFIIDIATHLARECRFANATKHFYSVAEHSVHCALLAMELYPDDLFLPLKALMHDAHEFLLGDLASPVKQLVLGYTTIADNLQKAIETRFGIHRSPKDDVAIDRIDRISLEDNWQNKVIKWRGLKLDEDAARDYFLDHFKLYCKTPYVLAP